MASILGSVGAFSKEAMEKMKNKSRTKERGEKERLENELSQLAQRRREGNVVAYQQAACMRHALYCTGDCLVVKEEGKVNGRLKGTRLCSVAEHSCNAAVVYDHPTHATNTFVAHIFPINQVHSSVPPVAGLRVSWQFVFNSNEGMQLDSFHPETIQIQPDRFSSVHRFLWKYAVALWNNNSNVKDLNNQQQYAKYNSIYVDILQHKNELYKMIQEESADSKLRQLFLRLGINGSDITEMRLVMVDNKNMAFKLHRDVDHHSTHQQRKHSWYTPI